MKPNLLAYIIKCVRTSIIPTVLILSCIFLSCSPKVADVDLPYDTLQNFTLSGADQAPVRWWTAFEDEQLNILVDSALDDNLNLKTIWYQLQEAQSLVRISSSALVPDLDMSIQSGISRPEPDFVGGENTQISLGSSYEVDLWGRIRYSMHAEQYRMQATYYDYKAAAVSLSSEITLTWFRLKATISQLELIEEQITTNRKTLALIRARFASGQVRGVDFLRQKQLIESTKAQKITLESQIAVLKNQLAVLLGQPPGAVKDSVQAALPELPTLPSTGVPLQLVNRRPDVQSAFNRLQASDRERAAAISNKYPRLNLSLTAAIRSNTFTDLFQNQALSLSAGLLAPLLYGGRLRADVERTEAIKQQRVNEYGQAVLTAFQEVENALIQETKQKERITVIEEQVNLASRAYQQLRIEYLNGSIEYLDVLVALNQEQQLRRDLINARMALLEIRVALYRALAGGFETERETIEEEES